MDLSARTHEESIEIAAAPEAIYAIVSDVTRTGEWSPVCQECWWKEGDGPRVGAKFGGRNVTPERTWETTSTVLAAEPGRAFAWEVGEGLVRWGYRIEAAPDGARLTESWEFTPVGQKFFHTRFGEAAPAAIDGATRAAHDGIHTTLETIKGIAEKG